MIYLFGVGNSEESQKGLIKGSAQQKAKFRFLRALLPLLLLFAVSLPLKADVNTPIAGQSLVFEGQTYQWVSPAVENGTLHTDTYTRPANGYAVAKSITVRRRNTWPSGIAQVYDPLGTVKVWYLTWDQNGVITHHNGIVPGTPQSGSWVLEGFAFSVLKEDLIYWVDDTTGQVRSKTRKSYEGWGGNLTRVEEWENGVEIPFTTSTQWRTFGSSTPTTGVSSHSLLGTTFTFDSSYFVTIAQAGSEGAYYYYEYYSSPDGGTLEVYQDASFYDWGYIYFSGTDPVFGTIYASYETPFSGVYSSFGVGAHGIDQSSTFAPAVLRVNGELVTWSAKSVTPAGVLTETWTGADGTSLKISGSLRSFLNGSVAATVSVKVPPATEYTVIGECSVGPHYDEGQPTVFSYLVEEWEIFPVSTDIDVDELEDWWEIAHFNGLTEDGNGDADGDSVTNWTEWALGTDPHNGDTDGDGMTDYEEDLAGTSPTRANAHEDIDGDRYPNIVEVRKGSSPFDPLDIPAPEYTVDPSGNGTHTTLSGAVAEASGYDVILVAPGTYSGVDNTGLHLPGNVLLISAEGASTTIIDGEGVNPGITLGGRATVEGFTVKNTSSSSGSAIYATGGNPMLINCVLQSNISGSGGGAIVNNGANLRVIHCTVFATNHYGIRSSGGSIDVQNSILWNPLGSEFLLQNSAALDVSHSIVRGGYAGSGNIATDPLITPTGTLRAGSPAINAAATYLTSDKDMHGEVRPAGGLPDIGADEWIDTDTDELPDVWENRHHGTLAHDGADDVDGDGLTEAGEYFNATSPVDTDSDDDSTSDHAEFATANGLVPTNLQAVERQANAMKISWDCNYAYETSFRVEKATFNGTSWVWTLAGNAPANATAFTAASLPEKTEHQFRVVTVGPHGNGTSGTLSATTKPAKPAAPTSLTVLAASATEVQLGWQDMAGNETGYIVEGKPEGGSFSTAATAGPSTSIATVGSLVGSTKYVFRVKAVNTDGVDTEYSQESFEVTLDALPGMPTGLSVASTLWNQAQLSWSLPVDETRAAIRVRGYDGTGMVQRFQIDLAPDALGYTDTGLTATTAYRYSVAAVNPRGESATSLQSVTTASFLPAAPSNVTVTALGARALRVQWTDNANNETGYIVERSLNSGFSPVASSQQLPANTTEYEDRLGLQGQTNYHYRVKAVNDHGSSAYVTASGTTSNYSGDNRAPYALGVMSDERTFIFGDMVGDTFIHLGSGVFTDGLPDAETVYTSAGPVLLFRPTPSTPSGAAPLNQVIVYHYTGSVLEYKTTLTLDEQEVGATPEFGACIVASGTRAFIGAPGAVNGSNGATGLVYVLDFNGLAITVSVIAPTAGTPGDRFGASVAVDGNRLIVGAPGTDIPDGGGGTLDDVGAAHLYEWNSSAWVLKRTEHDPIALGGHLLGQEGAKFGSSVSIKGQYYVVGAPFENDWFLVNNVFNLVGACGGAYLCCWDDPGTFIRIKNLLYQIPEVQGAIAGLNGSHFGHSVSIDSALQILIGCPDSSWNPGHNMADWDQGTVTHMQWNGRFGDGGSYVRGFITASGLPAGSGYGKHVEEAEGSEFAISTGPVFTGNTRGSVFGAAEIAVRPGQIVSSVEVPRRAADLVGLDEDGDPLAFTIPSSNNPLGQYFEIDANGTLKAKESLSDLPPEAPQNPYVLLLTVNDDRGGSHTKFFHLNLPETTITDEDSDGVDDGWELANGLDPGNSSDSLLDPDGDGISSLEEYFRSLNLQEYAKNPQVWDLEPTGDIDGDGVANGEDANPFDPLVGRMAVHITSPVNEETL